MKKIILILFVCSQQSIAQLHKYVDFNTILIRKNIGYDVKCQTDINKQTYYIVKYLGDVKFSNKIVKIVNVTAYFNENGIQVHAAAKTLFFNIKNHFIAGYMINSVDFLPSEVKKNVLIFNYNNSQCKATTKILFSKGIPERIFVHCNGEFGDDYELNRNQAVFD